ncbi:GntR family transcriptional regulator [Terribacillus saccharophilus]|uniref:GntR family transcriptional regulator n=1 Tax=Terribacillus saccharophilus TaxID=361277 RepID=A0A268HAU9_9BACI|nr:GntR family transcriptional regulator [Terribacillus saccharophilus]PAE06989.1 GntR family transcriptional regulator [Terribacillus saccharophilus]
MKSIKQIHRTSLRDQVYQQLRNAIINLELEPGERVNDKVLAEEFGVSRTPVREALKRLEDEGLIVSSPGSETKVSLVDNSQSRDAFTVVASLHELAGRLAIPYLTEEHAVIMEKINGDFEWAIKNAKRLEAIQLDDQFHEVILIASNNPEILVALERLMSKIRRLELLKFNELDGMNSVKQHHDIIQSIKNNKTDLPELMKQNWLSLSGQLTSDISN